MPLPVVIAAGVKAYSMYKTAQSAKELFDDGSKLLKASKVASTTLDQAKSAVGKMDGGISQRTFSALAGPEIDIPKLSGLFPKTPDQAALGMQPEETEMHTGFIASLILAATDSGPEREHGHDHDSDDYSAPSR